MPSDCQYERGRAMRTMTLAVAAAVVLGGPGVEGPVRERVAMRPDETV